MNTRSPGATIDKALNETLRAQGFKRRSTRWCRETKDAYLVLQRRAAPKRYVDLCEQPPSFRFIIWSGVFYKFFPDPFRSLSASWIPEEAECHIRLRLPTTMQFETEENSGIWRIVPDKSNLAQVIESTQKIVIEKGLPFLEKYEHVENAFERLIDKSADDGIFGFGEPGSPIFCYIFGYICLKLERRELAFKSFEKLKKLETSRYAFAEEVGHTSSMLSIIASEDYEKLKKEFEP